MELIQHKFIPELNRKCPTPEPIRYRYDTKDIDGNKFIWLRDYCPFCSAESFQYVLLGEPVGDLKSYD
jgi:hypothetical protein